MELFNILFLLLVVLTFCRKKNTEFLNLQTCNVLKGISILAVFVGHTSKVFTGLFLYKFFCSIGLFAVSIFFFVSGYGLMYGLLHKPHYRMGYLKKRILPLLICYALACVMQYALNGSSYLSLKNVLLCGYIPFSWFIFSIVCLYMMFYIAISIFERNVAKIVWAVGVMLGLYIAFANMATVPYPLLGGHQMIVFVIGLVVGVYSKIFIDMLHRYGGVTSLFLVLWAISLVGKRLQLQSWTCSINDCLQSYVFPFFVIWLLMRFKVSKLLPFWNFLQKHSLHVYLVHGIVLYACVGKIKLPSEILIFVIFIFTILGAVVMRYLENIIIMLVNRIYNE